MQASAAKQKPPHTPPDGERQADHADSEANAKILAALDEYAQQVAAEDRPRDTADRRYSINLSSPLPDLDTPQARAFAAADGQGAEPNLYALICPTALPSRTKAIQTLRQVKHAHFATPVWRGVVLLSFPAEERPVIFLRRPEGKRLSALLAQQQGPLPESFIVDRVIAPAAEVLALCAEQNVTHGRINLDNLYYKDSLTVGECVSEPCGYSQPFYYETVERMGCVTGGKGDGDIKQDVFALGAVVLRLLLGPAYAPPADRDAHLSLLLHNGVCNTLLGEHEFSERFTDFLRGTLHDARHERWHPKQIQQWLAGKHFHVIPPVQPVEALRGFDFAGEAHLNCRVLAHSLYTHWDKAAEHLRDLSLVRWMEASLRRKDMAAALLKMVRANSSSFTGNEKLVNDLVARTLIFLDPAWPIRFRAVTANADGIGTALAELLQRQASKEVQYLAGILEHDLPNIWSDAHKGIREHPQGGAPDLSTVLWNLDRVRILMRSQGLGFGIERCLYELNPELPCLSPLLAGHACDSLSALLTALNRLAPSLARSAEPMDRHIAAFMAQRLGIAREVKFPELERFGKISSHRGLVTLRLFHMAQEKTGMHQQRGLAAWVIAGVLPLAQEIHNRGLRQDFAQHLVRYAAAGRLQPIAELLSSKMLFNADIAGFQKAAESYAENAAKIEELRQPQTLAAHAGGIGRRAARNLAYLSCAAMAAAVLVSQL